MLRVTGVSPVDEAELADSVEGSCLSTRARLQGEYHCHSLLTPQVMLLLLVDEV